jgi:hypothetical protein
VTILVAGRLAGDGSIEELKKEHAERFNISLFYDCFDIEELLDSIRPVLESQELRWTFSVRQIGGDRILDIAIGMNQDIDCVLELIDLLRKPTLLGFSLSSGTLKDVFFKLVVKNKE